MKSKGNKVKEKTTESNREKAKDTQQQTEQTCTEIGNTLLYLLREVHVY